jgi:Cu/Ag efflux protein CusF
MTHTEENTMKYTLTTLMLTASLAWMPQLATADTAGNVAGGVSGAISGALPDQSGAPLPQVEGEIRKVDATAGKLTVRHGPIGNLDMAAMTMVFRVKDPGMLAQVQTGDKVRFTAERLDGLLTITSLTVEK